MERANIVIIGGGVVGCAVAMEVAKDWGDVLLLEQMPKLGMGASTRNSGVIHAGLYYKPGSRKARHCVEGNRLTYEFCAAHQVEHRRTGKLVVARSAEEVQELEKLEKNARENGVPGLRIVDRAAMRKREPHIEGQAALAVETSGIVSSEELVKAYARVAAERGANLVTLAKVERIEAGKESMRLWSAAGEIEARVVVNAAGLYADEVAALAGTRKYKIYPVRGDYCEVVKARAGLVNGLVYPMPHGGGLSLGVHLTKTLWGTVLVGPTVRYAESKDDYESGRESVEEFARRARLLLPEVGVEDLKPAYTGIRAKLVPPGESGIADFVIEHDADHRRIIHLVGIESPGLTSAPAIAKEVAGMVREVIG